MTRRLPFTLLMLIAAAAPAHELHHVVSSPGGDETVVIVTLFYGDDSPFAYESFDVFPPDGTTPFQSGYTDALGRATFIPDRDGDWRVRASSEDGHGANFAIPVILGESASPAARPLFERYAKPITGLALLFGIFGIVSLMMRRRT